MVQKECIIRQMDEREWRINCLGMETGKTMGKESWINGKYAFLFARGHFSLISNFFTYFSLISIKNGHYSLINKPHPDPHKTGHFAKCL